MDDAIVAARAAVAAASTPQHWNGLGDVLLAANKNEEALDALRRAISLQAGYSTALERMELALLRLGRVEEAVDFRIAHVRAAGQVERAELLQQEAGSLGPDAARRAISARRRAPAREANRPIRSTRARPEPTRTA